MNTRERRLVGIAGGAIAALILYVAVLSYVRSRPARPDAGDDLGALRNRVTRLDALATRLDAAAARVSVKLPDVAGDDQVQNIVRNLEEIAGTAGIGYTKFSPRPVATTRGRDPRRAGSRAEFDIAFAGNHEGLVAFFEGLESRGLPYVVESIGIKAVPQNPGNIEVTMGLAFVLLEPMKGGPGA